MEIQSTANTNGKKQALYVILTVFIVLFLDQWLKFYIKTNFTLGQSTTIFNDWFELHFTENPGMAFGLEIPFKWGKIILTSFRLIASVVIIYYIRNLIKEIGKKKTVMLSTHIMQEVEMLCSRVIIINQGKIVADRPTSDLQNFRKTKSFTIEFEELLNKNQLKKIQGVKEVKSITDRKWLLQSVNEEDIRTHIFQFAVENKLTILEIKQEEQKLEEIFQELTKS